MRRAFVLAVALSGCAGLRPWISIRNPTYFAEPPRVVARDHRYALVWRQGEHPFYYGLDSAVVEGRLVFAFAGSASSGTWARGAVRAWPITDARAVRALETRGAYWLEPDGREVRLRVTAE
jgi:hypothetical protein